MRFCYTRKFKVSLTHTFGGGQFVVVTALHKNDGCCGAYGCADRDADGQNIAFHNSLFYGYPPVHFLKVSIKNNAGDWITL